MSRPNTGPFRAGIFYLSEARSCDHCRKIAKRAEGGYVKKSRLRMIWCCSMCKAHLTAQGLELAA